YVALPTKPVTAPRWSCADAVVTPTRSVPAASTITRVNTSPPGCCVAPLRRRRDVACGVLLNAPAAAAAGDQGNRRADGSSRLHASSHFAAASSRPSGQAPAPMTRSAPLHGTDANRLQRQHLCVGARPARMAPRRAKRQSPCALRHSAATLAAQCERTGTSEGG